MSYSLDDTQPGSPFKDDPVNLKPTLNPEEGIPQRSGGSCLLTGVIGGLLLGVAVLIVALSAAAGWTAGQREANTHATATQNAAIGEQLERVPAEITSGNLAMLDARLRWLATLTPGVPGVSDFAMTATALYESSQVTPTPEFTPTAEPTEEPEATEALVIPAESSDGGYDLAGLLNQAENAIASSQWQDAIDYLDVILAADPNFETANVRRLMSQALNSYARELYNASQPAQANLLVTRAREFGPLADGLEFENMAAELYLTARSAVGTGSPRAASALQSLLNLGPGRYYTEAQDMLYNLYVTRGDAYFAQGDTCSAVGQYQNAINIRSSGVANGKYSAAQNACANATPTTDPNIAIPSDGQVAPVGEVSPPGG
ncbi:MAG: hypothetical protein IT319_08465 [Anaerolineae bacterium]|nr:hypothetical protein [Anaerolineae bacterium]